MPEEAKECSEIAGPDLEGVLKPPGTWYCRYPPRYAITTIAMFVWTPPC